MHQLSSPQLSYCSRLTLISLFTLLTLSSQQQQQQQQQHQQSPPTAGNDIIICTTPPLPRLSYTACRLAVDDLKSDFPPTAPGIPTMYTLTHKRQTPSTGDRKIITCPYTSTHNGCMFTLDFEPEEWDPLRRVEPLVSPGDVADKGQQLARKCVLQSDGAGGRVTLFRAIDGHLYELVLTLARGVGVGIEGVENECGSVNQSYTVDHTKG